MGHRKKNAPKRGSLAYLPRARAKRWVGRVRFWPKTDGEPKLLAFCGYKAGMTHVIAIDTREGALTYGKEIAIPVTVIETPPILICAIRAYEETFNGLKTLTEAWIEKPPKDLERVFTLPERFKTDESLKKIESSLDKVKEIRVVAIAQPRLAGKGKKKPEIIEIKIDGGTIKDQFEYAKSILGKEIKVSDVFKEGQWIDVIGITKGKGIQGPVKRWGVKKLSHKSRKKVRGVGTLGPWHPHYVMYTVPRAGQMGFHQRIEYNKQILKIGNDGKDVNPKGGFIRYGIIKNDYVMLKGSTPGSNKRLLIMRYACRAKEPITPPPKIEYISLESKQGG
ncbi:MAG: 50S ribosomal protein L3 [Candidatus Bathyarchaeia archaeon]